MRHDEAVELQAGHFAAEQGQVGAAELWAARIVKGLEHVVSVAEARDERKRRRSRLREPIPNPFVVKPVNHSAPAGRLVSCLLRSLFARIYIGLVGGRLKAAFRYFPLWRQRCSGWLK
jgi:hypothetical protein